MGKVLGIRGDVREGRGRQPDRLGKGREREGGGEAERYENDLDTSALLRFGLFINGRLSAHRTVSRERQRLLVCFFSLSSFVMLIFRDLHWD